MNQDMIWNDFLEHINQKVSYITYSTWFKPLELLKITDRELIIKNPGKVVVDHLTNNYKEIMDEVLSEITDRNLIISFKDEKDIEVINEVNNNPPIYSVNNYLDTEENTTKFKSNIREDYTFDNFVVGESNRYAFQSCLEVAQNPGKVYNPLFLYGKSGLGKTHLMHAIGNYIQSHSNLRVLYIQCDDFVTDFIKMSKNTGSVEENLKYIELFKHKYRDIDVLIIDDIQFLANATASRQEFTNTFSSLYNNEKQIIICSDRSVDDLKMFEDRLKTRFNWGLKAIINIPDYDLKVKIIKNKIKTEELMLNLTDDVIGFIASNSGSDVRNLEGMVRRLVFWKAMMHINTITIDDAREALDEYTTSIGTYYDNSITKIKNVVAEFFDLKVDDLNGKKRSKEIANARMIAMYLCRILTDETYPRIGLEFGGRDHSTVIHAYEKISDDLKTDSELDKQISDIKMKMGE